MSDHPFRDWILNTGTYLMEDYGVQFIFLFMIAAIIGAGVLIYLGEDFITFPSPPPPPPPFPFKSEDKS